MESAAIAFGSERSIYGQVHALRGTLHLDPVDDRSWQAAGWRLNEHREQIVSSHLGFEVGASGTG